MSLRVAAAALAILAAAGPRAQADTLPPLDDAGRKSLTDALALWSGGLLSGQARDGQPGATITPGDGSYAVAIPVQGEIGHSGAKVEGSPVLLTAKPRQDGSWALDDVVMPSPLRLILPKDDKGRPVSVEQTIGTQKSSVLIDPELKQHMLSDSVFSDWKLSVAIGNEPVSASGKSWTTHVEWVPTSEGRVDRSTTLRMDDIAIAADKPAAAEGTAPAAAGDAVAVGIQSLVATTTAAGVDPRAGARMIPLVMDMLGSMPPTPPAGQKPKLTEAQRQVIHQVIDMYRQMNRDGQTQIEAKGLTLSSAGQQGKLDRMALSERLTAPSGDLEFAMRMEAEGLHLPPDLPVPPNLVQLIPHKLVFAPRTKGIPLDEFLGAFERMIDSPDQSQQNSDAEMKRIFTGHTITTGLDELSFDMGPAALLAKGSMTVNAPTVVEGDADIRASGFDAFLKLAQDDPVLKQGVAALIFVKGIGKAEGDQIVWLVGFHGGKLTVNGTDMSAMIPQGK